MILTRTIAHINEAGPKRALLSAHVTCDYALGRLAGELDAGDGRVGDGADVSGVAAGCPAQDQWQATSTSSPRPSQGGQWEKRSPTSITYPLRRFPQSLLRVLGVPGSGVQVLVSEDLSQPNQVAGVVGEVLEAIVCLNSAGGCGHR